MTNQKAFAGNVNASTDRLTTDINLFLFDLKNEATALGFKTGETWVLELASDQEAVHLKKNHLPVVSLRLQASALLSAFWQIKDKLQQPLNAEESLLTAADLNKAEKKYLMAYPTRITYR